MTSVALTQDPAASQEGSRRAAVYRLHDATGTLLYIGSAYDPERRCERHEGLPWWPQVAQRTEEWHPSRGHAYSAEMQAIADEHPRHNVMGTPEYREECRRAARQDPARRARIAAGSAAANGAPREIVDAILRGEIKSYTKKGPVYFE
jgi:hypothetical protein